MLQAPASVASTGFILPFLFRSHFAHDSLPGGGRPFSARRTARAKNGRLSRPLLRNHRSFFTLFGLWVPVDVADTLLKGRAHFASLRIQYRASAVILGTLFTIGADEE